MDPRGQFCHNPGCSARGQLGLADIRVQSQKERRYPCSHCGEISAATRETPFYHLKQPGELVTIVIILLCHGCPVPVVAAFGLDERTIANRRDGAGRHGRRLHERAVVRGQVDQGHLQADELNVKAASRQL
jgi:hypothetical protein